MSPRIAIFIVPSVPARLPSKPVSLYLQKLNHSAKTAAARAEVDSRKRVVPHQQAAAWAGTSRRAHRTCMATWKSIM